MSVELRHLYGHLFEPALQNHLGRTLFTPLVVGIGNITPQTAAALAVRLL